MSTSLVSAALLQDPTGAALGGSDPAQALAEPAGHYAHMSSMWEPYTDPVTLVYLVSYTLLIWILLSAPLMGARGRKRGAAILGLLGLGPLVMLVVSGTLSRSLDSVNPFLRGSNDNEVFYFVTGTATAPGWQWVAVTLAALWVPGLLLWMRANRKPNAPVTLLYVLVTSLWCIGLRVGVELTAGPSELDFATRVNHFLVHLLPFVGFYVGRRGGGFFGFVVQIILANVLFRSLLVGWSYFATTMDLGTWLDVGVITDFQPPPPLDEVLLHDASQVDRWWHAALLPQMTLWVVVGTVVGLVLGLVPWLVARRNPDV